MHRIIIDLEDVTFELPEDLVEVILSDWAFTPSDDNVELHYVGRHLRW